MDYDGLVSCVLQNDSTLHRPYSPAFEAESHTTVLTVVYAGIYIQVGSILNVLTLANSELSITPDTTSSNVSVSYTFSLTENLETVDIIDMVLPQFGIISNATVNASTVVTGCNVTFSTLGYESGTATARLQLTATTGGIPQGSICTVTIGSGLVSSPIAQPANLDSRGVKFTLANAEDVPLVSISNSSLLHTDVFSSSLSLLNPVTSAPTSITFVFALNTHLSASDVISIVLPDFTITNPSPSVSVTAGCGNTTFTAAGSGSGTATAMLELTAATATLPALTACTVSIPTGITTASSIQDKNLTTRTMSVSLSGQENIAAQPI